MNDTPFFVIGSERSGSTMLRLMIGGHEDLSVLPEFEFSTHLLRNGSPFPDSECIRELSDNWIYKNLNIGLPNSTSWPKAMREILTTYAEKNNASVEGAVVHKDFEELPRIFSRAKYIHLVRDPRDVAYSVVKMGWASNVISGLNRWLDAERSWNILKSKIPPTRILEIKYEDLVLYSEDTLRDICLFLEVPYDTKMLEFYKNSTYDKPNKNLSYAWQTRLSEEELSRLEYILGDKLEKYDYTPSGITPKPISKLFLWLLPFNDWIARVKHRRQLYGTLLLLEDFIVRKLHIKGGIKNRLQRRMESIWLSSLK